VDLTVHGGKDKAVYCYPIEHYEYWRAELPGRPDLPMGVFGANFTIEGFTEGTVHIGDRFSIGSAEVVVTQPRLPCYKLGIRFESDDMAKRFLKSGRTGFYVAFIREGEVGADDDVVSLNHDSEPVSVSAITQLYVKKTYGRDDIRLARQALRAKVLPESWKEYFEEKLHRLIA